MARIEFHPTADDARILRECAMPGETPSDTLRRALRSLAAWGTETEALREALVAGEKSGEAELFDIDGFIADKQV